MKATDEQIARVKMMSEDTFGQCESDCAALAAVLAELTELRQACKPFAKFAEQYAKKPPRGMDDVLYSIHEGTEYEAAIRLSDCQLALAALAKCQ